MTETTLTATPPLTDAPVARRRTSRFTRVLHWTMIAGLIAALPFVYEELPDVGATWTAATRARPGWLLVVVAASLASMGMFARLQRRMLRIGGLRISLRRAAAITYAGNALSTTLPAGPAVSVVYTFHQFRRGGAPARLATAVIILGGIVTTSAYTLIGLAALVAEPHARAFALMGLAGIGAGAAGVGLALWRPRSRALLAALAGRVWRAATSHRRVAPWAARLRDGFQMLRPTRYDWGALLVLALLNWAFDILALYAAARAVDVPVTPEAATIVYFAAQAAGSVLPILPGGLGAIESSMAASLVALGATLAPAAAAVAVYRVASYWAIVAIGWAAWFVLHEGPRVPARVRAVSGRAAQALCAALADLGRAHLCVPVATSADVRRP
ncbi:TIGR00374: family protein [Actinomadura rubteroloni]|uniref:TIGR00374: family protein n=1 Tax=Actinomadura rubteroloni TaxID=1926885 RepID=A0A2P4UHB8_9ACTN|nr:lysylphosphatidylglycerol synthase transmembrane domain-containing protein [Actinomadura rubteroloni]POM24452.1 TIGR00374: family protein [Actinomadura rubteroloni]